MTKHTTLKSESLKCGKLLQLSIRMYSLSYSTQWWHTHIWKGSKVSIPFISLYIHVINFYVQVYVIVTIWGQYVHRYSAVTHLILLELLCNSNRMWYFQTVESFGKLRGEFLRLKMLINRHKDCGRNNNKRWDRNNRTQIVTLGMTQRDDYCRERRWEGTPCSCICKNTTCPPHLFTLCNEPVDTAM